MTTTLDPIEPEHLEEMLVFLDRLRETGVTNMFGARPYLEEAFGIRQSIAGAVLSEWMRTFAERHPAGPGAER